MTTNGFLTLPVDASTLLVHVDAEAERQRLEAIGKAWAYYHGEAPDQLKVHDGVDDNVRVNVVAVVVDASVDALWGEALAFSVDEPDETDDDQAPDAEDDEPAGPAPIPDEQAYLDGVWDGNRRMSLLHDLALNGAMAGSALLMIVPRDGVPIRVGAPETYPRLVNLDPTTVVPRWDQDDLDRIVEYVITWTIRDLKGHPAVRRKVLTDEGNGTWVIVDEVAPRGGRFEPMGPPVVWPYPWPPIVACKNLPRPNEWWGQPDVGPSLLKQQDAINAVLSNSRRVTRLHGHPKVWASGIADGSELDVGPEEAIILPDGDSRVGTLGPGAVIDQHLSLYERLRDALFAESRVPPVVAGKLDNIGQLSGLAMRILYGPLVRKTLTKRRSYGEMLAEVNQRLLELASLRPLGTTIAWPEVVPQDELELATAAEAKQRAGVSKATTLRELGYDPDEEAANREDEGATALEAQRQAFAAGAERPPFAPE